MSWIDRLRNLLPRNVPDPTGVTVKVERKFRECVSVVYREPGRTLTFNGELVGPKWNQINMTVGDEVASDASLIANLVAEFTRQGHEFVIYRAGKQEPIPQSEGDAARAELRQMGFEVEVSPDGRSVRQTRLPGFSPPSRQEAQQKAVRMMKLLESVRGFRWPLEIVAKSDSASL